ncbi:aminotransferase class IV [bacterium]|nr:aminotransferase class IV [bacterium]
MPEIAYINNSFTPLEDATVSINDRGYLFADGIYEVAITRNRKPFLLKEHLDRLQKSADALLLELPLSLSEIGEIIKAGINQAGFTESMVYIQITRGVAPRRHNYPADIKSKLTITFRARPEYAPNLFSQGVAIITVPEIRWSRCDIKSIALLPNIMMKQKAVAAGCQEALFVSKGGIIRECTTANIFIVKNQTLLTPPANQHILNGITRSYILQQATILNIKCIEKECSIDELHQADELFITSSTIDLLPVIKVDNLVINNGKPGPLSQKIKGFF